MRKAINDGVRNRAGIPALITDGDNATLKIVNGLLAKITNYETAID